MIRKFVFESPNGKITSMVTTKEEFDDIVDKLKEKFTGINAMDGMPMTPDDIEKLRKAQCIPCVARGTKTQFLFDLLQIETDHFCICVEGFGKKMTEMMQKFTDKMERMKKDAETNN
jgi:hypothetical protein